MVLFDSLRTRLAALFLTLAAGSALMTGLIVLVEAHYHFQMYERQVQAGGYSVHGLNIHLEQALQQSVGWTFIGTVILASVISIYVARRISGPLVEMTGIAGRMAAGELDVRVAATGRDEVAQLGRALNHLAKALAQHEDSRKTMTADIAHELRTPLATLKSHLEAFLDGVWEPDTARLRGCYEEIERLIRLVRDVEALAEVEAPSFRLEPRRVNLCEVAARAAALYRPGYLQKGVDLAVACTNPVWAEVDPERLTQVVTNLLSNALKATPRGGKVTIQAENAGEWRVIRVQDTGCGVPPHDMAKVFERFYQVGRGRSRDGGSGIGLTIVKRLAEAHGGRVHIQSELRKGTVVQVDLPAVQSSSDLHNPPVH